MFYCCVARICEIVEFKVEGTYSFDSRKIKVCQDIYLGRPTKVNIQNLMTTSQLNVEFNGFVELDRTTFFVEHFRRKSL